MNKFILIVFLVVGFPDDVGSSDFLPPYKHYRSSQIDHADSTTTSNPSGNAEEEFILPEFSELWNPDNNAATTSHGGSDQTTSGPHVRYEGIQFPKIITTPMPTTEDLGLLYVLDDMELEEQQDSDSNSGLFLESPQPSYSGHHSTSSDFQSASDHNTQGSQYPASVPATPIASRKRPIEGSPQAFESNQPSQLQGFGSPSSSRRLPIGAETQEGQHSGRNIGASVNEQQPSDPNPNLPDDLLELTPFNPNLPDLHEMLLSYWKHDIQDSTINPNPPPQKRLAIPSSRQLRENEHKDTVFPKERVDGLQRRRVMGMLQNMGLRDKSTGENLKRIATVKPETNLEYKWQKRRI
ncbi:uncharacterized protein LOC142336798 isoform X2 [Convolutriloba macropyga]|uniref:uncharacterized protein LOC142336798 isoform X2 n=1 Tax=Convolutriloba macropyga TaxID=536237 RepID=UPI003F52842E